MLRKLLNVVCATALACAVFATAGFSLSGCQNNSTNEKDADLVIWVNEADYRDYIKLAVELYETQTNTKIFVKVMPDATYIEEVSKALKDGTGPDVLLSYNNSDLAKVGISEHFMVLNDQKWVDQLMDGAREYCDDGNGNLMGLPFWESSISGCYYNKTMLSDLGLKPATTQAEFDALCATLKAVGKTPLFWGDGCGWMYQFGLDPIFADDPSLLKRLNSGEINYADIPEVRSMVQWIYDANQKGWLGNPKGKGMSDVSAPLASGEAVMVDIWDSWFETDFVPGKYKVDDFAIMPVFLGTARLGSYEGGNLNMMLINKEAKHKDKALELLEFCAKPETYNTAFNGVPSVAVFKDQNTIVTSNMLVEASSSIAELERSSTANPKILGYSQQDMIEAFTALLDGKVDVDGCIAMMDEKRRAALSSN